MRYVFFDIECANTLHGEGKRCSFGYVKTDEDFNVLQKEDIIRNPSAPFLLGNAKTGKGISLAYPIHQFESAPLFPRFYYRIRNLLSDPKTKVFGFDVCQDASFVRYACVRYNLPVFEFEFFDIQKFEKELYHRKNPSGLQSLINQFNLQACTYHRSDDDAYRSREVFKAILENNSMTVKDAFVRYPSCKDDLKTLTLRRNANRRSKALKRQNAMKIQQFYTFSSPDKNINCFNDFFWGKKLYFSRRVLSEQRCMDFLMKYRNNLTKSGAMIVQDAKEADVVIVLSEKFIPEIQKQHPEYHCVTYRFIEEQLMVR